MDAIFAKIAEETTNFGPGDEEMWRELYEPIYPKPPTNVAVVKDERYGPAERNTVDIYYPSNNATPNKPVLFYLHGGGFFSGDKAWSEKVYANIGYCFALHGIIVVAANHQLVPNVTYPGGAEDVQLAREWIFNNIAKEKFGGGSVNKVVLFGHSSGGAHIAMNLYGAGDSLRKSKRELFPPVAGIMYLSVPFWFDRRKPVRQRIIRQYFGSDAEEVWAPLSPLGLFNHLPAHSPLLDSDKVPIYLGSVKWEVKETADATIAFFNAYRERSKPAGTLPEFHVLDKHNHLSNILSIGTSDTRQSERLLEFILSCAAKASRRADGE